MTEDYDAKLVRFLLWQNGMLRAAVAAAVAGLRMQTDLDESEKLAASLEHQIANDPPPWAAPPEEGKPCSP